MNSVKHTSSHNKINQPNYVLRRGAAAIAGVVMLGGVGTGVNEVIDQATTTKKVFVESPVVDWQVRTGLADEFRKNGVTVTDLRQIKTPEDENSAIAGYVAEKREGPIGTMIDRVAGVEIEPVSTRPNTTPDN